MTYPTAVHHAVHTLLWCSVVTDPSNHDGNYLEADAYDLAPDSWQRLALEWGTFRDSLDALGFDPSEALAVCLHPDNEGDAYNKVAHDWILTRNGHGAGFWDGDWHAPWGDRLTKLAQSRPELSLYLGADDLLHLD